MRKIPTVFVRDPDDRKHVTSEVTPSCEWVLAGEGVATRKYDGTCCMLVESESMMSIVSLWWARREVKKGKAVPDNFVAVNYDKATGKTVGWEPMAASGFAKWHVEALENAARINMEFEPATYELVGPKINGNPENFGGHYLVRHGADVVCGPGEAQLDPVALVLAQGAQGREGIVWHHPDGRMAKLKARDIPAAAS